MTTTIAVHDSACTLRQACMEYDRKQFLDKFPGCCLYCGGLGGQHYGGTYHDAPDWIACHECTGFCPRCGYEFPPDSLQDLANSVDPYEKFVNDEIPCPECGLNLAEARDQLPPTIKELGYCFCTKQDEELPWD